MDAPGECRIKDTVIIQAEGKQVATSVVAKEVWISGELSYVVICVRMKITVVGKFSYTRIVAFYGKVVILKENRRRV